MIDDERITRAVKALDRRYERGCRVVNRWLRKGFGPMGLFGRVAAIGLYALLLAPIMLAGFFRDPEVDGAPCNCWKCAAASTQPKSESE